MFARRGDRRVGLELIGSPHLPKVRDGDQAPDPWGHLVPITKGQRTLGEPGAPQALGRARRRARGQAGPPPAPRAWSGAGAGQNGWVRILIFGTGVIGSVYGERLLAAGHDVVLLARSSRLRDLRESGLVLQDAQTGHRTAISVTVVAAPEPGDQFDLVVAPVRRDQLPDTLPLLTALSGGPDVLFFGNALGRVSELASALGGRAVFGFPAVGGVRDGATIRYVLIRQQRTMLGEASGAATPRLRQLQSVLSAAGFPTRMSADVPGWLTAHAAFVVPIAYALYRDDTDAAQLSKDSVTVRQMVRATRQAFHALRASWQSADPWQPPSAVPGATGGLRRALLAPSVGKSAR